MKQIKSERLKKLEVELQDLERWLKLGLVPKKDIPKHQEEIELARGKIDEEKERLQFLKESGEIEEYVTPKRGAGRTVYTELPTIPDIDLAESGTESQFDVDTENFGNETSVIAEGDEDTDDETASGTVAESDEEEEEEEEEEESYFSDKNRWRRGGIVDPDADEW